MPRADNMLTASAFLAASSSSAMRFVRAILPAVVIQALATIVFFAAASVHAQTYPTKPIRLIVPYAPGGGADNLSRVLLSGLTEAFGQSVVIDNRAGGAGTIGTELAARSPPDGYTIAMVTTGHTVNPSLFSRVPYDAIKDFAPISLLASQSNILVVHPAMPAKSVKELVEMARAKPGGLNFASGGNGSSPHLSGELLKLVARIDVLHIPYKGAGPGITDLVGGHVQMMFVGPISIEGHIRAGRLRALAVADRKRLPILPDVPTMAEAGFPGIETGTWYAVLAPAGTPQPIITRLHDTFVKVTRSPDVAKRLAQQGMEILAGTPAELSSFLKSEIAKWSKVVKAANLKVD